MEYNNLASFTELSQSDVSIYQCNVSLNSNVSYASVLVKCGFLDRAVVFYLSPGPGVTILTGYAAPVTLIIDVRNSDLLQLLLKLPVEKIKYM